MVDFDGDIPEDKLFELQKRLKNKDNDSETKGASFITSKDVKLIKEGKPQYPLKAQYSSSNNKLSLSPPPPPPLQPQPQQKQKQK